MKVDIATTIALPPAAVWRAVQTPDLLRHIAWPLIRFTPVDASAWPEQFTEDLPVPAALWLFGVLPLGKQWIVPSLHLADAAEWPRRLRDNGYSRLIRRWDHWISVEPDGEGGTFYRDTVDIDAGILTPFVTLFAQLFYRHRQRRWRGLAGRLAIYHIIWDEQKSCHAARALGDHASAWTALKARHILSQPYAGPHISSHIAMLGYAWHLRDWREVGGQLLRLALAPIGNATGRLPNGNHGRARVNPFRAMPLPPDLAAKLAQIDAALPTSDRRDTR